MKQTVEIIFEDQVSHLIKELSSLLKALPKVSKEVLEFFVRFRETPLEFISINVDNSAANTGELRALLQPTDAFRDFLATVRAGNV